MHDNMQKAVKFGGPEVIVAPPQLSLEDGEPLEKEQHPHEWNFFLLSGLVLIQGWPFLEQALWL
jgi:hypothetical protein